jgi:hypothetical protein
MPSQLVEALQSFTDPHVASQLRALDAAIQAIDPASCTHAEYQAMLGIFERFPDQDGFEVFWGIVHALERCEGYEPELLVSVDRKPCEFNVTMVNRLLNAGVREIGGRSLVGILRSVLTNGESSPQALHYAQQYLARHEAAGEA